VNGVCIIDKTLWDDVDQLWAYMSDMVLALNNSNESSTFSPDQPIKLTFRRLKAGNILISLTFDDVRRSVSANEASFIFALQQSGQEFFHKLKKLLPENAPGYDDALERLAAYKVP